MADDKEEKVSAFLTESTEEREKWRETRQIKYKTLEKSSIFCDIIVQVLLDLQYIRERYEDGILLLHDIDGGSVQVRDKAESGMKDLYEGLKKHMQLQDYLFSKYEYFVEPNGEDETSQILNCKDEKPVNGVSSLPLTVKMEETEGDSSNTSLVNNHHLVHTYDNNQDVIDDDDDLPVIDQLEDITDTQDLLDDLSEVKTDIKNEDKVNLKKFECEHCYKTFNAKKHLLNHTRIHTGETPYKCHACDKTFRQISSLNVHKRSRHTGEKPFCCDQCTKQYGSSAELKAHQRIHTGEKPFQCNECPKAFALHTSLKHHRMTHTGEKPFKCDQCGHGFIHRGQLNTHMRSHTGEKPYKCDQCGRGFTRSFDLGTHMRTHTGEKPYKCTFCSNSFAKKHTLANHIRIHTGEKPYKCEFCEKEFRQQGDMAKHRRKKHNVQR